MTPPPRLDDVVAQVRQLPVDAAYLRSILTELTSIGSSELGFRTTGTPEDAAVAAAVAERMRAIGLDAVATEPVDVDAWRFVSARVSAPGLVSVDASSFGGVPPTPREGLTATLVDVGDARRTKLDRVDLDGSIALVAWTRKGVHPSVPAIELAARGAVGMIVWCPPGGAWFQAPDALGAFDAQWPSVGPPMIYVNARDGLALRDAVRNGPLAVTMTLDVDVRPAAVGHNVVGFLHGDEPGPIVVGAHHDAWFRGAFDNTSGVAVMLTMAKAMVDAKLRPRHTICFTSRTGEEFGLLAAQHDWCVGAWHQIASSHPSWGEHSPFHLCLEASGRPGLRTVVEAPVEYRSWARAVCRAAEVQGWTPTGWRVAPPVTGTEQWPYLLRGVPGVAAYAWETAFADTEYHTQLDTPDTVDDAIAASQARLYALLLLDADRRPDEIVDHRARARELDRIAGRAGHEAMAAAAERHRTRTGRAGFTAVGRALHAVDAEGATGYPHHQATRDTEALEAALVSLDAGDRAAAARHLRRVGSNRLYPFLSKASLQHYLDQFTDSAVRGSWGSACHLTQSPNLWDEITGLRAGSDVRPALERALDRARRDRDGRLAAMAAALTDAEHPDAEDHGRDDE